MPLKGTSGQRDHKSGQPQENPYLKPYTFHGLDLPHTRGQEAIGECVFCGRSKLSVNTSTGVWRCWRCAEGTTKGGGNWMTFIRLLWQHSEATALPGAYDKFAKERNLLSGETLRAWGIRPSLIDGNWLVPGFQWYTGGNGNGQAQGFKLMNLYRYLYSPGDGKYVLWQTPGKELSPPLQPQLFGVNLYDPRRPVLWLCEGVWDAMCLWEVVQADKKTRGKVNVLGTPGTNIFRPEWAPLFAGKEVYICYDNDHRKFNEKLGREIPPASIEGVKRVIRTLTNAPERPGSIKWLKWGEDGEGYDATLDSGYDLRDLFKGGIGDRRLQLGYVEERLEEPPPEWLIQADPTKIANKLQPLPCDSWAELVGAWKKAMSWTEGLHYGLAFSLAIVASTKRLGDQLWGKLMSPPSTGKTTLAEALGVAEKYVHLEDTVTGFYSGFKGKDGADYSLMAKTEGKTLIFKDADSLLKAQNRDTILSEMRGIYDTNSSSHYKNDASRRYRGSRRTIILCGTSGLRELDSSDLGERFLTYKIMERIDDVLEDQILLKVARRSARNVNFESNGEAETQDDPEIMKAKQLTAGYVIYLRENGQALISRVRMTDQQLVECARLGKFVAFMRARPSKKQDEEAEREFGARLVSQLTRLAKCLAAVLGKDEVDRDVMTQVRKVALDTAQGRTLHLAKILFEKGSKSGLTLHAICNLTGDTEDKESKLLYFLKKIHAVEKFSFSQGKVKLNTRYKLTPTLSKLYEVIIGHEDPEREEQGEGR